MALTRAGTQVVVLADRDAPSPFLAELDGSAPHVAPAPGHAPAPRADRDRLGDRTRADARGGGRPGEPSGGPG